MLQVCFFVCTSILKGGVGGEGDLGSAWVCTSFTQQQHEYLVRERRVCVFNGQYRVRTEPKERLGYDPKLLFSPCTKGLLNFHTEPALLHNTQFREYTHAPAYMVY